MATYIANRLSETESLITAQSGQVRIGEALAAGDFAAAAEVNQHGINVETVTLSGKLEATEPQVARMSSEIAEKAGLLNQLIRTEIVSPQSTCGSN
jgi:ABC-type taurine transport system substrate-binding protein